MISIVTAFLEILFFCGVGFGWPSLEYVLKKEGYFINLCDIKTSFNSTLNRTNLGTEMGCKEQHSSFNLIFTLAVVSIYTTAFLCGWLLDRYGTWIFRSIFTTVCIYTWLHSFDNIVSKFVVSSVPCVYSDYSFRR